MEVVPPAGLEPTTYRFTFVAVTDLRGLSLDHAFSGLDRGRPVSAPFPTLLRVRTWLRIALGLTRSGFPEFDHFHPKSFLFGAQFLRNLSLCPDELRGHHPFPPL